MAKKIKRFQKSEFGKRKLAFPKGFEFLEGFNFQAIVEDNSGLKVRRYVEVSPAALKKVVVLYRDASGMIDELRSSLSELIQKNEELLSRLEAADKYIEKLEHNNELMMSRLNVGPDEEFEKSSQNFFDIIEERGIKPRGLPMQGGIPGLGRRR